MTEKVEAASAMNTVATLISRVDDTTLQGIHALVIASMVARGLQVLNDRPPEPERTEPEPVEAEESLFRFEVKGFMKRVGLNTHLPPTARVIDRWGGVGRPHQSRWGEVMTRGEDLIVTVDAKPGDVVLVSARHRNKAEWKQSVEMFFRVRKQADEQNAPVLTALHVTKSVAKNLVEMRTVGNPSLEVKQ